MSWLSKRRESKLKRDVEEWQMNERWFDHIDRGWLQRASALNVADEDYWEWRKYVERMPAVPVAGSIANIILYTHSFNGRNGGSNE